MIYLALVFCLTMTIMGKITEKKLINPVTAFYSVWVLILCLTSIKLYGINTANDLIYSYMLMGFMAFALGYYFPRGIFKSKQQIIIAGPLQIGIRTDDTFELRYQIIFFLCIFTIVVYLIDFSITIKYLLSGNALNYIRHLAQDSTSELNAGSGVLAALKTIVISPFVLALQPIVAIDFWLGRRGKKLLWLNIAILLLRVLTDGSRSNLIYFILHFIIGFVFIYSKKQKSKNFFVDLWGKKRSRRIIIFFGVVGIGAIIWATKSRSGEHTLKYAYYYFAMEPYMFETWAKTVDNANMLGFGLASTNGFTFVLFYVLKNLGLISYPELWHSINTMIGNTQTDWMIISSSMSRANAYVSLFWYLYLDGRIAGIIIGMLTYGCIAARSYWTAIKNMSSKAVCIYAFILQGLIMSFVRLQFANITYAVAFVIILLLYKKTVIKERRR